MAVSIDEMLKHIGEFRQYQWFVLCLLGYCLLTAGSFNAMIVTFITAEPDWKCVDGYMNNTVCRFNKSITLTSDDYKARCEMPREAWTFVDDFSSIVTEVRNKNREKEHSRITHYHCCTTETITRDASKGVADSQIR